MTEEDLRQCIDDVTSLKENGKLWSPDLGIALRFARLRQPAAYLAS